MSEVRVRGMPDWRWKVRGLSLLRLRIRIIIKNIGRKTIKVREGGGEVKRRPSGILLMRIGWRGGEEEILILFSGWWKIIISWFFE